MKVERQSLGKLTGHGTAEFFAVVARDPAYPHAGAKGMEIYLRDGERQARVYPDEDSLGRFELDLTRLARRKDQAIEMHRQRDPDSSTTWVTLASDSGQAPPLQPGTWNDVPQIGLYGINSTGELGVCIFVYRRRNGYYYFPSADLTTVADFIAAGRKWLAEH